MGFLDRLKGEATPSRQAASPLTPVPDSNGWYGRRFRTPATVEECQSNLVALLLDGVNDPRRFDARWAGAEPKPDILFGVRDTPYGNVYVAIWQSGSMVQGQREVAVVPTRFDGDVPLALAGQWKQRDGDLASIGHITEFPVEASA